MKLRLRHLLAAAFMVIATVPLLILGIWVQQTAMEKEVAAVSEKHLLLAQNVTLALDRYALDAKSVFSYLADSPEAKKTPSPHINLADSAGFRHFCIVDSDGWVKFRLNVKDKVGDRIPKDILDRLKPLAVGNDVAFSGVMADEKGRPTIYLVRRIEKDRIAIAALDLGYIHQVQKAIQFGKKGHSAIVDRNGAIIAHPNAEWQRSMKNIAKVKPVQRMMAGETGVTTFYSPAVKKDMISGYTTVPATGWGVMVPQPMEELEERANDVIRAALALIVLCLFAAALISWVLSGLLVRPVEAVVRAARGIEGGNLESRVSRPPGFVPVEFQELGSAFNAMARDIATVMIQRERVEDELRQAHDELEERVKERTRELTQQIAERERAEEGTQRLVAAIEELSELFVLYDADDRLVMCNEKYREINKEVIETTVPGTAFEEHQRALMEHKLFEGIEGREEEFFKERLDRHKNPRGPFEVLRNGQWFIVNEQKFPDGSTATISTNITERKESEEALRQSEERLRGAIGSLQEGFALFDADDKLVALNDEYRRVSQGAQEVMERGGTFEDVIRANVESGMIPAAKGRKKAFIKERLEQHRNPKGPIIRELRDGTWFMIEEAKTPEGGTALSFIDITELKKAEEALRNSRKRFKDFAEVASDWFWEMDRDLRFSFFSGRNFQVTGYKPADLIGKTRREVTKEDTLDEKWQKHLDDLDANRPFRDFQYQLTKADGEILHISISGTPIFDAEGNFKGYRGTGTDITAQVTTEEALREAKDEAEFASRAKTEFLANMSHELRTPLNSVIGFSDILMGTAIESLDTAKAQEYVRDINDSGKHLLELINDILDVARIERGLMELNEKKLDVPLLMASCQRLVNDRAFDAGVQLKSDVSPSLPALLADELRTKQILLNLLSNAIKFTPQGGQVKMRASVDADDQFSLSVIDTGIGIAPENIETALSDFGQVDGTFTRKFDGAGLGLPLSKKLAELHGGELSIESKVGIGTTVTVKFPKERTIPLS